MKKYLLLTFALVLFARENPFVLPGMEKSGSKSEVKSTPLMAKEKPVQSAVKSQNSSSFKSSVSSTSSRPVVGREWKKVADFGFIAFKTADKKMKIKTGDRLKRAFLIKNPKKAVFDFKSSRAFPTKVKKLKHPNFKEILVGSHAGYYRVAVSLDKKCRPKLDKKNLKIICR